MIKLVLIVFVLLEVDVTLRGGCGIWENCYSPREAKGLQGCSKTLSFVALLKELWTRSVQDFILLFLWCKSGELGGTGNTRFPCVFPVVEGSSWDLLQALRSYYAELNWVSWLTSDVWLNSKCTSSWRCCPCRVEYSKQYVH